MADFEEIRNKELDVLTDDEKEVIKEHVDDLTDEEKEAFKDFTEPEPEPESEEDPPADPPEEDKKEEPAPEEFKFKTESDFKDAVKAETDRMLKEREEKAAAAKTTKPEEEERFFPEGYQAKDWDEAAKKMFPKFKEKMQKEQEQQQQETKKKIDEINNKFNDEINELAKTDKTIPDSGTPEREEYVRDLYEVAKEYRGITTMAQAHKIHTVLKAEKKDEPKKEVSAKQKDVASKVGRSGGEGKDKKERSYSDLSNKSLDELLQEEEEAPSVKS